MNGIYWLEAMTSSSASPIKGRIGGHQRLCEQARIGPQAIILTRLKPPMIEKKERGKHR